MKIIVFLFFFLPQLIAHARPEFAVRHGVVNCSACHNSPFGGGSKNVNGKLFFTRTKPMGNSVPAELYSLDLRMNGLFPKDLEKNNNGLAIMSTIGSAHIPVETGEEHIRTKFVGDYDFGVLGPGLRNAFVLIENNPREPNLWFKHILIGKFNVPFGLLTDEHWSFLRLQTKTTLNDFDTGFGFSGDPTDRIHYDFAITSSNTTSSSGSGRFTSGTESSPESKMGLWFNLRSDLESLPMYWGLSSMFHSLYSTDNDPWALSAYTVFSLQRALGLAPITFLFEAVLANQWNRGTYGLISNFTPAGSYFTSIEDKKSLGASGEFQYEVLPQKLTLMYKYEQLALDEHFASDLFQKNNLSLKWYITSNLNVLFRAEQGSSNIAAIPSESTRATKSYYYLIAHYWM